MDERKAIVTWLRSKRGKQINILKRIWLAYMILRHGEMIYFAARSCSADFIERGEHLKDTGNG